MLPSLSNDEIEDRYFLLGRMEIISVLNDLIHRREPVTVYFNGGRDVLLTTLLEARHDALVFDLSGDVEANKKLPGSPSCVFVSHLNGIRVQFSGAGAQRFSWGGADAFWVPLPERVVRLQRRESYRILLPVAKPLMIQLYGHDDKLAAEWAGHDLSVGGLGMNTIGAPKYVAGDVIPRLVLALPKVKPIDCAATVRHVTQLSERGDGARFRVGVSFDTLPPGSGVAIQRYIIKIEHERRKIARAQGS